MNATRPQEHTLKLRIICQQPPNPEKYGAEFGLQDNSTTKDWVIHAGRIQANDDIHFDCECRVRLQPPAPRFFGPFVHGPAAKRFLYLSWRPMGRNHNRLSLNCPAWVRRIKVHLGSITMEQVIKTMETKSVLQAVIKGTGPDGGPSCASVPLIGGGWTVQTQ